MTREVPSGFEPIPRLSPFNALVGPLYQKRDGERLVVGVRIAGKHANSRGICHGGMLATLADLALGYAMMAHSGREEALFVTASLSIDFAGSAKVGDWVESAVDIQRSGSRLAFANCYLVCGGRRIVRASAIFAHAGKAG